MTIALPSKVLEQTEKAMFVKFAHSCYSCFENLCLRLYAQAGVREYWIIDLERRTIEVFALRGHSFALLNRYEQGDIARSEMLPDFEVAVGKVCPP